MWQNTYGKTWEEKNIASKTINTMEPRNIQSVAALAFQDYSRIVGKSERLFLGRGIISEEGVAWKRAQNMVKPIFSRSELSDVESFRLHVERFLNLIPRDGSTVNMQPYLQNLVFLCLATTTTGMNSDMTSSWIRPQNFYLENRWIRNSPTIQMAQPDSSELSTHL